MQDFGKVGIDLLFCLIIVFIIIKASSSVKQNEELTNSLSLESARISSENIQ